jgi:hypothetical protein
MTPPNEIRTLGVSMAGRNTLHTRGLFRKIFKKMGFLIKTIDAVYTLHGRLD